MKSTIFTLAALSVLLFFNSSCNESTLLGADIFQDENLNLSFTDTLGINALNESNESVIVSSGPGAYFDYLPIGKMKDSTFGISEAVAYTQLDSTGTYDFASNTIDSVVFIMGYNANGVYGDTTQRQKLSLYRLAESFKTGIINSDQKYALETAPLAKIEFSPQPRTNINTGKGLTTLADTAPQARFKIDNAAFIQQLKDTSNYASKDGFRAWLRGLAVKADNETTCMLSMDFGGGASKITGLYIYHKKDTTKLVSSFRIGASTPRHAYFNNNYANAPIKSFLDISDKNKSDSLLFIQSMSGANIRLEIPYIRNLGKVVINKAELEFTIKENNTQFDLFPPIDQLIIRNGQQTPITDAALDGDPLSRTARFNYTGGFIRSKMENGQKVSKYIFNVSTHLQKMLEGSEGSQIYIAPFFRQEKASRVVLYGLGKNAPYRVKINVTYTKVK